MSIYTPDWDKILNAVPSTTAAFGGEWANLISDYFSGTNIGLIHPTKRPKIGTTTFFKFETLKFYDNDESHTVTFSVDDIDTGAERIIKIRRMNTPYITDHLVLEGMPQAILNKTIDFSLNTGSNIPTSAISDNAITNAKMADNSVSTTEIADNSITNAKMADNAIDTIEIVDGAVTLGKLAINSVDSSKIVNNSIVNDDIGAHTSTKITITDKAQLNSNVVYNDQANIYGSFDQRFRSTFFSWYDSDASHRYIINTGNLTANIALIIPALSANDTFVFKGITNIFTASQTFDTFGDHKIIAKPADPSSGYLRIYPKSIDANNDGWFTILKKNGVFTEVQVV